MSSTCTTFDRPTFDSHLGAHGYCARLLIAQHLTVISGPTVTVHNFWSPNIWQSSRGPRLLCTTFDRPTFDSYLGAHGYCARLLIAQHLTVISGPTVTVHDFYRPTFDSHLGAHGYWTDLSLTVNYRQENRRPFPAKIRQKLPLITKKKISMKRQFSNSSAFIILTKLKTTQINRSF